MYTEVIEAKENQNGGEQDKDTKDTTQGDQQQQQQQEVDPSLQTQQEQVAVKPPPGWETKEEEPRPITAQSESGALGFNFVKGGWEDEVDFPAAAVKADTAELNADDLRSLVDVKENELDAERKKVDLLMKELKRMKMAGDTGSIISDLTDGH